MKLWVAAIALPLATALRLPLPFTRGLRLSVTRSRPRAGAARMPSSGDQLNKDLENVLSQNKAWSDKKAEATPHYFEDQAKSQHPKYLWIGCADARVPANEVMGEPDDTVFVHRNVANQVLNTDMNCMSVIQYAVDYLKIPHIIVCGHYDCGGVRAAVTNVDHSSPLENWLRNIRDVYRLHRVELDAIADMEARHRRLVELNVIEQCLNVFKACVVQRRRVATHVLPEEFPFSEPRVHAMVYDPGTGLLKKMDIDFNEYLKELGPIYNLYEPECVVNEDGECVPPEFR